MSVACEIEISVSVTLLQYTSTSMSGKQPHIQYDFPGLGVFMTTFLLRYLGFFLHNSRGHRHRLCDAVTDFMDGTVSCGLAAAPPEGHTAGVTMSPLCCGGGSEKTHPATFDR